MSRVLLSSLSSLRPYYSPSLSLLSRTTRRNQSFNLFITTIENEHQRTRYSSSSSSSTTNNGISTDRRIYPSSLVNPRSPYYASLTSKASSHPRIHHRSFTTTTTSFFSTFDSASSKDSSSSSSSPSNVDYIVQGSLIVFLFYGSYQIYTLIWQWPEPCEQLYQFMLGNTPPTASSMNNTNDDLLQCFGGRIYTSYIYEGNTVTEKDNHIKMKIIIEGENYRSGILYGFAVRNTSPSPTTTIKGSSTLLPNETWLLLNAEVHIIDPQRYPLSSDGILWNYLHKSSISVQRLWSQIFQSSSTVNSMNRTNTSTTSTTPPSPPLVIDSLTEKILGKGVITIYNLIPHNKSQRRGFIDIDKDIDTIESLSPRTTTTTTKNTTNSLPV